MLSTWVKVIPVQFVSKGNFGVSSKLNPYILVSKESLLGKSVNVYLKEGAGLHYKITECGLYHFGGYDSDGLNISIAYEDIDYIEEVN